MKTKLFLILACISLFVCGCLTPNKFEPGGAYADNGTQAAMPELFATDSSFDLAYKGLDLVFKYEKDNRLALWNVSPKIKHAIDDLRKEASKVWLDYAVARQSYLQMPTPGNLTPLQTAIGKLSQINSTALAVIAKKGNQ